MAEPFLSEIRIFSFVFPPKGWALCNGQILPISQNQALFSLLGTNYGGNGTTNFALPNLQGRIPLHAGNGFSLGQNGGEAVHTLTVQEMPMHWHGVKSSSASADQISPSGNLWANGNVPAYAVTANAAMAPAAINNAGVSQSHQNMSPYLTLSFCIALQGNFPSQT